MNRKLIRPDLTDMKDHRHTPVTTPKYFRQRRAIPPDQTNAEGNYYLKQMANKTRMVIVLKDGEELRGTIEWYDRVGDQGPPPGRPQHSPDEGQREVHVQGERGQGRRGGGVGATAAAGCGTSWLSKGVRAPVLPLSQI